MNRRTLNLALAPLAGALAAGIQYALQAVKPGQAIDYAAVAVYFFAGVLFYVVGHELGYSLSSPEQQTVIDGLRAALAALVPHRATAPVPPVAVNANPAADTARVAVAPPVAPPPAPDKSPTP